MDVPSMIITIMATVAIQSLIIVYVGNRFLKYIFGNLEALISPNVKKYFSLIGKQSGENRRSRAAENEIAQGFIDKQLGPLKLIADKVLGINIDEMVEEYGAVEVLNAAQTFLPMLQKMGINVDQIIGQVTGQQERPQGSNTQF